MGAEAYDLFGIAILVAAGVVGSIAVGSIAVCSMRNDDVSDCGVQLGQGRDTTEGSE